MYKTEAIGKTSKEAPLEKILIGREGNLSCEVFKLRYQSNYVVYPATKMFPRFYPSHNPFTCFA